MNPWLIWQLADSAFPSGGFAHSGGMEAAWQHGMIPDDESLTGFVRNSLKQLEKGSLAFVVEVWRDPTGFSEVDRRSDLFLNNHVANRSSRAQGRAFLAAVAGVFDQSAITTLVRDVRQNQEIGHFAPIFGLICREIGVNEATTAQLFGFVFLRSQISVAVRLGIIGPIQGQQIQAKLSSEIGFAPSAGEPVQTAPVLDLVQATQDRLYSRLFQS